MEIDEFGEYKPKLVSECSPNCELCLQVCPFNNNENNEDTIGNKLFAHLPKVKHDNTLGYFQNCYVGYITDEQGRFRSASGGMTSGLLKALLAEGLVERVIVPQPTNRNSPLFEFRSASSEAQIEESKGSVYHPLQMADVLREVIEGPDLSYAMTLLPCFAKAVRLTQQLNPKLKSRVKYVLGLTCGGCPNAQFTEVLSCASGLTVPEKVEFRNKQGAKRASDFRFASKRADRVSRLMPFYSLYGFLWLNKFFSHRACAFCDDVFAETADICLMDAWLPAYTKDRRGTSLAICRNEELGGVIEHLSKSGRFCIQQIRKTSVIASQAELTKYKRIEISTRVDVAKKSSRFVPAKRVKEARKDIPSEAVTEARFNCWADAKRQWAQYRSSVLDVKSSRTVLRLRTWFFCYRLYRQLRSAHIPVMKRRALLLPRYVIAFQLIFKDWLKGVRNLLARHGRVST